MRIAHVSDVHIRNLKYRAEYTAAFDDLYEKLEAIRPDLVINTGDTVHSKLSVSPELFDDVAWHLQQVTHIAPYWLILGNHDLNLKNKARLDAISPIVNNLQRDKELRLLTSGRQKFHSFDGRFDQFTFWHYDIRGHEEFTVDPSEINIGLYHGSISGCVTDIGYMMEEGESEISKFDAMDFVLMGDIHKRQSFRDGRMRYPGSLIQQNYGEELEKGFLLWDIRSKDDFEVTFHPVVAPHRFYTISVPSDLTIPDVSIPDGSRVRVMIAGDPPPSQRIELESKVREKFHPVEVICSAEERGPSPLPISDIGVKRTELMREYLQEKELLGTTADQVIVLAESLLAAEEADDLAHGTSWKIRSIEWDSLFNYGDGNRIDVEKLKGLVGIFAPNSSGKSSIFDILLQAFYDKISKDVPRNIDLINDNMDSARIGVEFTTGGQSYSLERKIERIKYGQRKADVKQWGKTSLDLSQAGTSLNGTTRPETERTLQGLVGSFEDFALTTMISQNPIFGLPGGGDIINCKETDRRKILFRFLNLDVYERVFAKVRDELRQIRGGVQGDRAKLVASLSESDVAVSEGERAVDETEGKLGELNERLRSLREKISKMAPPSVTKWDLASCEGDLQSAKEALAKITASIHRHQDALRELRENRPMVLEANLGDLAERIREARKSRDERKMKLTVLKTELGEGKMSLKTLESVPCEGKFPTCRFISDAVAFASVKEELESAVADLKLLVQGDEENVIQLEKLRVASDALVDWERAMSGLELKISQLETSAAKQLAEVSRFSGEIGRIRRELSRDPGSEQSSALREEESAAVIEHQKLSTRLSQLQRELGAAIARRDSLREELVRHDAMLSKAEIYEHLAEMVGKGGLPYQILSRILPVLNSEIARVLSGITKFTAFFEDDPEHQAVGLRIRYGDYKSRPLSLGGGAEKFISALAIRVALLTVSSLPKTDALIIDEGFGKLDPENLEAINRIFDRLRTSFESIFIISHVDSMRDIVDHSIDIVSRDGYAYIHAP